MQTRKRGLIDCRNNLGLCISYDRSLAYFNWCCQYRVCKIFHWRDGLVCPPQAFSGVFTTAAVDNIDHNPSSTSAHGFFHDTALSLLQHPTHACPGRYTETSYSGQWEHTRQAFSPHHYQLNTMWSILLCCPPWPNGAYSRTSSAGCIAACPSTGWKLSGQLAWWHDGNFCEARVVRPRFCFMGCLLFTYTTRTFSIIVADQPLYSLAKKSSSGTSLQHMGKTNMLSS